MENKFIFIATSSYDCQVAYRGIFETKELFIEEIKRAEIEERGSGFIERIYLIEKFEINDWFIRLIEEEYYDFKITTDNNLIWEKYYDLKIYY